MERDRLPLAGDRLGPGDKSGGRHQQKQHQNQSDSQTTHGPRGLTQTDRRQMEVQFTRNSCGSYHLFLSDSVVVPTIAPHLMDGKEGVSGRLVWGNRLRSFRTRVQGNC
jgi:hypothetical protein